MNDTKLVSPTFISEMLKIFHWKYKREKEDVELSTIFDFSTISNATNHFLDNNKLGVGGFGKVYRVVNFSIK